MVGPGPESMMIGKRGGGDTGRVLAGSLAPPCIVIMILESGYARIFDTTQRQGHSNVTVRMCHWHVTSDMKLWKRASAPN